MGKTRVNILQLVGGGRYFGRIFPIGGAGNYVLSLSGALDKRKFNIILAFLYDGPTPEEARRKGFPVHIFPRRFKKDPALIYRIMRFIKEKDIDLVNTHLPNADFFGRLAARFAGTKAIVTTMHSFLFGTMAHKGERKVWEALNYGQEMLLSRLNHRIITVCETLREKFISQGIKEEKIVTIPPGVDLGKFNPSSPYRSYLKEEFSLGKEDKIVGTVGRLVPAKNLSLFLRVAREVTREVPGTKFVLVGDGPLKENLEREVDLMGLTSRVIFTGWREDVERIIPGFDLFLLTSTTEGMPLSLLQAMASGIPVAATGVGGVPEIVRDEKTGFLCEPGNLESLRLAVISLLRDRDLAQFIGSRGRELIEDNFDLRAIADKTMNVYEVLLD